MYLNGSLQRRRRLLISPAQTLGLTVFAVLLVVVLIKVSKYHDEKAPKDQEHPKADQPVIVPKAAPSIEPIELEEDLPAGVHVFNDPCQGRQNPNWHFVQHRSACQFARDLLMHDDWAVGVYETMLLFGQRITEPIATMRGHCRRMFEPLLTEISYLENFGYASQTSRRVKRIALRCIGDIKKWREPDPDDAAEILAEAALIASTTTP